MDDFVFMHVAHGVEQLLGVLGRDALAQRSELMQQIHQTAAADVLRKN